MERRAIINRLPGRAHVVRVVSLKNHPGSLSRSSNTKTNPYLGSFARFGRCKNRPDYKALTSDVDESDHRFLMADRIAEGFM